MATRAMAVRLVFWARLVLGACALSYAAPALAQEATAGSAADAAEARASSFQAVEGAVKEDVPGGPLLVLGYGVLWVALLLYVLRLAVMQQGLQRELGRLERALGKEPAK